MKRILCVLFCAAGWAQAQTSLRAAVHRTPWLHEQEENRILTTRAFACDTTGPEKPAKKFSTVDKVVSISTGIAFGAVLGAVVGAPFGDDEYGSAIRGALIGASVFPFVNYEFLARRQGAIRGLHGLGLGAGVGLTTSNHNSGVNSGVVFGIRREYRSGRKLGVRGEVSYAFRRFSLPAQSLYYSSPVPRKLLADVNFGVGYVDIALLFSRRFPFTGQRHFVLSLGPALSVVAVDKTDYTILSNEEFRGGDFPHDFVYVGDEPARIWFYPGYDFAAGVAFAHLRFEIKFKLPLARTHQIFPLLDKTALHSLHFTAGYSR
ncbi:glycine zipper family protein [candidate division KSB1 bacterium]|nr:glycine zipper family protein [bacterium]NUM64562.1 glycine zipper family protein [candidate division KSB1 bacterium]